MADLYFNKRGYYISGPGIEIARSCPPLMKDNAPVFSEYEHLYIIFGHALREAIWSNYPKDITVYNDSRMVDEFLGDIKPDESYELLHNTIKRSIIPGIQGMVWFRKKSPEYIDAIISDGFKMFYGHTSNLKKIFGEHEKACKQNILQQLKEKWFNGN